MFLVMDLLKYDMHEKAVEQVISEYGMVNYKRYFHSTM